MNLLNNSRKNIQEIAESVYEDRGNLNNLTSVDGQPIRSGITILDPYTGDIVAIVGDMGQKEGNLLMSYATDRRQVGSSIKPLTVYAAALDSAAVTPATTFDNYPVRLLNGKPWPKNSPNTYTGWTMLGDGVRNSINTIAVQTVEALGIAGSFAFATEKLNLGLVAEDMALSPLAMGGLTYGLNTVEMAAAYAPFVNNGIYTEPRTYVRVLDANGNMVLDNEGESHVAMKESTAYFMNKMLKSVVTSGTGTSAKLSGMTVAGKTGTTSDNYDRYFVGYTPYYVASVWTGYKYNAKISYSGNPAITLWKKVMSQIHEGLENKDFAKPTSGIENVQVCRDSGLRCTDACRSDPRGNRAVSVEVASGTAPTKSCTLHVVRDYCTAGKCLAGEHCPDSSVVKRSFLNHKRTSYGVTVSDSAYLLSAATNGTATYTGEDGTEVKTSGCPVHTGSWWQNLFNPTPPPEQPTEPNETTPPSDVPTEPNSGNASSGETGEVAPETGGTTEPPKTPEQSEPVTPPTTSTPTTPATPGDSGNASGNTSGNADGEWWGDLWSTP